MVKRWTVSDRKKHGRTVRVAVSLLSLMAPIQTLHAGVDKFDYDPSGRLIRRMDDQSKSTDYLYDISGNISQVGTPSPAQTPIITSGPLGDFRQNEVRQVSIAGTGLVGAAIRSSHPGVAISNVVPSATAISFRLTVAGDVPLGGQSIRFENTLGAAQVSLNVIAALTFSFEPAPMSVAPDGIARKFTVKLGAPLSVTMSFGLGTLSPSTAKTKASQLSIPAGQVQADIGVIGVATGTTLVRISGGGLSEPVNSLVYVGAGEGDRVIRSNSLGITRSMPFYSSPSALAASSGVSVIRSLPWAIASTLFSSSGVSVVRGGPWRSASSVNPLVAPLVGINRP